MAIKYRLIKMVIRRLIHFPQGLSLFKYLYNRIKYIIQKKRRKIKLPHPVALMVELTNHCQLKCVICAREYEMGKQMDTGHMNLENFKKLIDKNHIYLDRIGLTGLGETLLHPQIIEAVKYIRSKNKGISIFISTNAYQANAPEIIKQIADDIDTLQISLDGIGSVFEEIRQKSNYDKYYSNLKSISKMATNKRMTVKYNMVVYQQNYHQMKDVILLADKFGIKEIFFNTFNMVANNLDLSLYDFYKKDAFLNSFKKTVKLAGEKGIYLGYHEINELKGFNHCDYPWDNFYITWDGFLVPCCAKPFPKEKNFGNVFEVGLMNTINNADFLKFRELSNRNITPEFCQRCHKIN